ncbi:periplasmic chaperone for outer membrane proteins SurA [Bizionia echini]|uniref:Periplasmic chaperone for outer membrane proteins SurA n=1 Tax=Bizionia echini TaxID=649333 RepID=A0A1I5CEY3_9FLAO|nr:peptidylprolyl isomerase [Bizionia echini]SFN85570.1 periplasmic chaperone for outer membrane proteins SurA [Bizionia echini]
MLLKINNLKSTISRTQYVMTVFAVLFSVAIHAQEIIEDEAPVAEKQIDTTLSNQAQKIDGVAAVVGEYVILDSDVDANIIQLKAQGASLEGVTRCQLFGKLLEDKLYAHHAIQDSIVVSDAEIRSNVDYQLQQFLAQSGKTMQELLELYNHPNEKAFRDEMYEINKSQKLASEMQKKILDGIEVTPEETRQFFNQIPKDERPTFGTELKVSQIVIQPKISEEENQRVINQLKQFKADVLENGANFRSKVVLYSDDKASIPQGGMYTLNRKQPRMVKEFREVAFSLQEGEISDPVKTEYGYHLIYLEKIRGQEYDVRHILLIPKVSETAIAEAREKLVKIRQRIVDGDISFADAARESSDEKETRSEGGFLINPETQDYNFELTKIDPEVYGQIQDLKDGEVSLVLTDQERTGNVKFKIMMVSDRVEEHVADYARDYLKIKELALNEKRIRAIDKWQNEKIMDTYIKINNEYRDCEFSSNWLKQ